MSYAALGYTPGYVPSYGGPATPTGQHCVHWTWSTLSNGYVCDEYAPGSASSAPPPSRDQTWGPTDDPWQQHGSGGAAQEDTGTEDDSSNVSSTGGSRGGYPGYPDMDEGVDDGSESAAATSVQWFLVAGAIIGIGWLAIDVLRGR